MNENIKSWKNIANKFASKVQPGIQKINFTVGQPDKNGKIAMPKEWWKSETISPTEISHRRLWETRKH